MRLPLIVSLLTLGACCSPPPESFHTGSRSHADNPEIAAMIADPDTRQNARDLLRERAKTGPIRLHSANEPGKLLGIFGQIQDAATGEPIANALVEIIHADASGKYFDENSKWNPRLFAYVKTDADGRFQVTTIRPGGYADDSGEMVPPHIHYSITANDYIRRDSEFLLSQKSLNTGIAEIVLELDRYNP